MVSEYRGLIEQRLSNVTWRPGQSGNPKGRTLGVGEVARLRAAIAEHVPQIVTRLVERATVEGTCRPRGCCWSGCYRP